ncbi:hypothetical protein [Pollutimonas thiosulfatoxidans]|uniref:Uncharacterized protein n=1 Tax=Pollutimonas thiosulfatoxidans TaxID=2028345 RepID=A0A410GG96_9BURK|nr:hypothetical protein [Pollutimonas thiosulfatoxidans]NYT45530.1 hypothetical protein [Alcaligenaceae bacterium]QAA95314.1 hypothetical protein CKA81_16675 [Pollutimonas thiosulfatoxidans]
MANSLFGKLVPAGNLPVNTGQRVRQQSSWVERATRVVRKLDRRAQGYFAALAEARRRPWDDTRM